MNHKGGSSLDLQITLKKNYYAGIKISLTCRFLSLGLQITLKKNYHAGIKISLTCRVLSLDLQITLKKNYYAGIKISLTCIWYPVSHGQPPRDILIIIPPSP